MTRSTRKFAAIVLGGVFALSAVTFTDFIRCAFAGDVPAAAAEIGSTLLPVASEPAPRLTLAAPLPGPLARGAVLVPYKVENLRILPVLGEAADDVSPRVGHLHVTVDDLPWHWSEFSNDGTIVVVGLPVVGFALVAAWRRLAIGQTLEEIDQATATAVPQIAELEYLRGRTGRTVSPMRPSGSVLFDGRRVDALTEGIMLDAGVWVKCVSVQGGRVIVRQLDTPPDLGEIEPGEQPHADPPAPEPPPVARSPRPSEREPDDFDLGFDLPPK